MNEGRDSGSCWPRHCRPLVLSALAGATLSSEVKEGDGEEKTPTPDTVLLLLADIWFLRGSATHDERPGTT